MPKRSKARRPSQTTPPERFKVTVSRQAFELLQQLKEQGFYGRTEPEVAARLIHDALLRLLPPPELTPPAAAPESSVESPGSDGASKPRS